MKKSIANNKLIRIIKSLEIFILDIYKVQGAANLLPIQLCKSIAR